MTAVSNKFQKGIHFKSLDSFVNFISLEENRIFSVLREIIFEEVPNVKEKLSYNVPFYSREQRICFIWPASIPWGNNQGSGVKLGFNKGYLMNHPLIEMGDRKKIGEIYFNSVNEIDVVMIRDLLMEALLLDRKS